MVSRPGVPSIDHNLSDAKPGRGLPSDIIVLMSYAYTISRHVSNLHNGGLAARGEGVGQTALAAVLTVLVEGHLHELLR
jgi:hypothetical protein